MIVECLCPYCKKPAKFIPRKIDPECHILECNTEYCNGNNTVWCLQLPDKWYHKVIRWFKSLVS